MRLDAQVQECMSEFALIADPSQSLRTALRMMERYDVPYLPVVEGGKILGIIGAKEIDVAMRLCVDEAETYPIREFVRKTSLMIGHDTAVGDVLNEMNRFREACAIVTKNGKLFGLFTWLDVIHLLVEDRKSLARAK